MNAENVVFGIALVAFGMLAVGAVGLFYSLPRGECLKREAWHLDGGSVIQAHGTKCVAWREGKAVA